MNEPTPDKKGTRLFCRVLVHARVEDEWAVTAKVIHVRGEPRVDVRSTNFFPGNSKSLLRAAPTVIGALFRH